MSNPTYEAAVYSRVISYKNFNGEAKTASLHFALDPIQLLQVIATGMPTKTVKSGDPRKNGQPEELSDADQLKFIRDLAAKSAGWPSDDGETWTTYENFLDDLAGKAFITKLAASDADRREFSDKVMLAPFRAFVEFAAADESNTQSEVKQFQDMLGQLERVLKVPEKRDETDEERRARLRAELESLNAAATES